MSKVYTDYINKVAVSVPDRFIDVKTGESYSVSLKVQEQIEYHAKNSTLIHLVFSALHHYLKPKAVNETTNEILHELSAIKRMLEQGYTPTNYLQKFHLPQDNRLTPNTVDMREVDDVLEAFGG